MIVSSKEFKKRFLYELENAGLDDVSLTQLKTKLSKEFKLNRVPKNSELLELIPYDQREEWVHIFRLKPIRSASGVLVVAIMTPPTPCPHGKCEYCPGGVETGSPQSYTGGEPATLRGIQNSFDAKLQTQNRLRQYAKEGHRLDKIELIIMGGTFPATPPKDQEYFVREALDGITGEKSQNIEEAKFYAEASNLRNVGITVETRPDWANTERIKHFLKMGVTRVEVGVQHPDDEIYKQVKRGHTVDDVVQATRRLKDAGLKINYHLMPNLPGSTPEKDKKMFREIFTDNRFKPDMLKIYPTLVLKGTSLYDLWKEGKYKSYSLETTISILSDMMEIIPNWIRIQRVQRDIPARLITDGPKKGNLHQIVLNDLRDKGKKCNCIRCREVGIKSIHINKKLQLDNVELLTEKYEASEGLEYFLSYEDKVKNALVGFLRLRIPSPKIKEINLLPKKTALIRELHVYGPVVPVGKNPKDEWQHKGWGKKLLKEAERITKEEHNYKLISVTSGLGVREYYGDQGYKKHEPYMLKKLI
ncbi:MAG: tRNA uridine(34) 5-carboxymethylaminomethyl modification radical SAM/GNAT enzyme Elp3 [Candidatus Ranarchaeia archaeon]